MALSETPMLDTPQTTFSRLAREAVGDIAGKLKDLPVVVSVDFA